MKPIAAPEYMMEPSEPENVEIQSAVPAVLNRSYETIFSGFLFITVFFPSGTLYGFNLKLPFYAALLPLAGYRLFQNGVNARHLLRLASVPAVLALWIVIGLVYGFETAGAMRQYTDIILTMLLCWLATLFSDGKEERSFQLVRLVLTAEIATSLMKLGLIIYALARGIPVSEVVIAVSEAFGVNLMTMDLADLFGRVQFVSDALIPICIYIVFRHRARLNYGAWRASCIILLLLVSVLLSFSRYFWIFSVIGLLLGLLFSKRDRFQLSVVAVLAVAVLASLPVLSNMLDLRFSQAVAGASDLERAEQSQALQKVFFDAPFLGHGLGSYTNQVIRDETSSASRYGYEMQLLALSGQIGIVGISLLTGLTLWYFRKLWTSGPLPLADRIGITVLLLCWFSAGLYNPLLLNPVAGVSYIALAALADLHTIKERTRSIEGADGESPMSELIPQSE